ncbi:hydroxyphenylacetyl-CoA thioesterase PaaI [Mycoplana dimorpha]|uniref:(3S)-malyl-CoA thioesterase n=1 Tax=Mycoplana dimorpha TaxID=28320 RepID=A0A2T5BAT3_MYCDI|nr:hydroxyphenylacetyl-CoA thioesterase PaaI [Mycoplana dimorpha]PTM96086.1 (3S)-malyl-CoA thioesterase [Mycoplana dimorpha]
MTTGAELASLSAQTMWESDRASQGLGMEIVAVEPGKATLAMQVREDMTNGHGTAHGGFIFALADSAFAFACNSYGETTVAAHCSISYIRPGRLGDLLVAEAREVSRSGRSGIYDVTVSADGVTIAEFRGHSRSLGSAFVDHGAAGRPA